MGFRVDANLADKIKWSQDPAIPRTIINETCERCPLTAEQCNERAVPPTLLEAEEHARQRKVAINKLIQG